MLAVREAALLGQRIGSRKTHCWPWRKRNTDSRLGISGTLCPWVASDYHIQAGSRDVLAQDDFAGYWLINRHSCSGAAEAKKNR